MPLFVWAFVVVALASLHLGRRWRSGLPRGPPGLPLLGNWKEVRGKTLHLLLTQWAQQYGDFFTYSVGLNSLFVVSGATAFDELFTKKGVLYNTRPQTSDMSHRVTGDSRGVALPYGKPWKDRRRVLQNILSGKNSKIFLPYQEFESKIVLINLLNKPETFYQEAARYSSSVTFSMLLGARFESSSAFVPLKVREEMILFWQHISPGSWLTDWLPFLDYLPAPFAPWRKKADWMHNRWVSFWSLFFDRMDERYKRGVAQDCFLARFLGEPDVGRWSHVDSVGIVAEILSAGTETTITSLQWFFRAAVFFPEAMELARREIDAVVGRERLPTWDDRPKLPYVEALVDELHRWSSIAPLAVPHATTAADVYQGFKVSKGASVIANTYAVHHDASTYPMPEKFAPGRFLPSEHPLHDPETASLMKHFAFGVGRRACPGVQVANASLYIVISRILWGFDIGAAPSGPPKFETLPSPLVVALAPFECSVAVRDEKTRIFIMREAESLVPPQDLESASVYDELVKEWAERNPR